MIKFIGSAAVSQQSVKPRTTPDIHNMNFILKYNGEDFLIPLTQPELLWTHEKFNKELPLVLFATGWTTNYNESENSALDTLYEAFRCRGNINFVVCIVISESLILQNLIFFRSHLFSRLTVPNMLTHCIVGLHLIQMLLVK